MSGPTGVTARLKKRLKRTVTKKAAGAVDKFETNGTLKLVLERAKAMSPGDFLESLVSAGIIGSDGELTPNYATTPDE